MPADHPNIDLHSHTTRSDGTLSPTALVQRARANGVDMLALTDHDVLDGLPEAQAAARAEGLVLIPGVEVSITWAGETIHIVGLRVDPQDATLLAGLEANRAGRTERAREMAAELERCGVPDAWEGALKYVGNPALISRSHFGRHLVALGLCASQREVFDHWLVPGKPGYVPQRWASLDEAVSWIRGGGAGASGPLPAGRDTAVGLGRALQGGRRAGHRGGLGRPCAGGRSALCGLGAPAGAGRVTRLGLSRSC